MDEWNPPRKFQVIGYITDKRKGGALSGKAVGSESVAELVLEAGGNAVILNGQDSQVTGFVTAQNAYGSTSVPAKAITTRFVVVKYLEQPSE